MLRSTLPVSSQSGLAVLLAIAALLPPAPAPPEDSTSSLPAAEAQLLLCVTGEDPEDPSVLSSPEAEAVRALVEDVAAMGFDAQKTSERISAVFQRTYAERASETIAAPRYEWFLNGNGEWEKVCKSVRTLTVNLKEVIVVQVVVQTLLE